MVYSKNNEDVERIKQALAHGSDADLSGHASDTLCVPLASRPLPPIYSSDYTAFVTIGGQLVCDNKCIHNSARVIFILLVRRVKVLQ